MNDADSIKVKAESLLNQAGFNSLITSIESCTRGGNNRTFRLETTDQIFAFKEYFRQAGDKRDRLTSEYAFLSYANLAAPGMTPKAYAKDDEAGIALYEFVDGSAIQAGKLSKDDIMQAAAFFCALNQARHCEEPEGRRGNPSQNRSDNIPVASEACFSIQAHLDLVDARVKRLTEMSVQDTEDKQAKIFIDDLSHHWAHVKQDVIDGAATYDLQIDKELAQQNRCISPSDFGFHNALKKHSGHIIFLDFEYAGWDDPAKMVGDFFSQLAVPIPSNYFNEFVSKVMQPFDNPTMLTLRATLLRQVYEIKWCCIALNVFIPVNLARRQFANPKLNIVELKQAQLAKARALIDRMEMVSNG